MSGASVVLDAPHVFENVEMTLGSPKTLHVCACAHRRARMGLLKADCSISTQSTAYRPKYFIPAALKRHSAPEWPRATGVSS